MKRAPPTCSLASLSQNSEKEQTMKPSLTEVTLTTDISQGSCNEEKRRSCEGIINRMNNRRESLSSTEL